jgi:hypothetical protein
MRAQATRPRRIWPWILLALIVTSAIIATLTVLVWNPGGSQPTANPTATASGTPAPDAEPTGCLGGTQRDAAMVLAAQAAAPHTSNGAIEVATAFVRWLNQYPYPATSDIAAIEENGLASNAPTKDIAGFFAGNPNLSGGLVPDGTDYYLSTLPGVYYLEATASDDVTASIGTALVIDGELSSTLKGSITVTMKWEDDSWKFVSSEGTRSTEELYSIGRPFSGGC